MTSSKAAILIADMDSHIDELKEQLAERDAKIEELQMHVAHVGELGVQFLRASLFARDEAIAQLQVQIAQLREKLNAVPIDALRRQYNDVNATMHNFKRDKEDVQEWLAGLDGDA